MSQQTQSQALANLFGLVIHAAAEALVGAMSLQHPLCMQMYERAIERLRVFHLQSVEDSEEKMFKAVERLIDGNGLNGYTCYFQLTDGRIALVMHDAIEDEVYVVWPQAKNPTQLSCVKYQGQWSYLKRHEINVSPRILEIAFAHFKLR